MPDSSPGLVPLARGPTFVALSHDKSGPLVIRTVVRELHRWGPVDPGTITSTSHLRLLARSD